MIEKKRLNHIIGKVKVLVEATNSRLVSSLSIDDFHDFQIQAEEFKKVYNRIMDTVNQDKPTSPKEVTEKLLAEYGLGQEEEDFFDWFLVATKLIGTTVGIASPEEAETLFQLLWPSLLATYISEKRRRT